MLAEAGSESDPRRRRALARSALAKARRALRDRDIDDSGACAGARGDGRQPDDRMIVNTVVETAVREHNAEREREWSGISL